MIPGHSSLRTGATRSGKFQGAAVTVGVTGTVRVAGPGARGGRYPWAPIFFKTHVTGTLLPPRPPGRRASRPRAANPSPQCGPPPQAPASGPCGRRPRADLGEGPGAPGSGTTRISEKRGECPSPPPHPGEGQNRGNCELPRGPACSCIQPPRSVSPRQLASSPARQTAIASP